MIETQMKQIGGRHYRVTQLGAAKGTKLMVRLFKLLGPPVSQFLSGVAKDGKAVNIADIQMESVSEAVMELSQLITEDEMEHVISTLSRVTQVSDDGKQGWGSLDEIRELIWAGNYIEMFKWLAFALEVNYAGFFGASGFGAVASALKAKSASTSPKASTGTSTESPSAPATPAA